MTDAISEGTTRANWRTAPFNRWAFRNVDDVVRTSAIAQDPGNVWALPSSPESLDDLQVTIRDARLPLDAVLQATASDGLVVLHRGKIVFERYDAGLSANTRHIVMSATKSVTGLVAGVLADKGMLDRTAPVSRYVPEIASTPYAGATVQHLLDMRAGVRLDEAGLRAYAAASGWEPETQPSDLHGFFAGLAGPPIQHGTPFAYISANTDLLGWAIERAAGQDFATLVSELLWKPMGAEASAAITTDSLGAPRCTGGLCATVRDFARVGQLLVEGGQRAGQPIIPASLIADIETAGDPQAWADGEFAGGFAGATMRYRNGWYVVDDAPKHLFAMGIHGQNLFVDRANRLVMAKVSSQPVPIDPRAIGLTHALFAAVRRSLTQ